MTANASNLRPLLFISHKHQDRKVADALRSFVESFTSGDVEVFQSSSEQATGPRAGFNLNQELKTALWRAGAFVMIYTQTALDWSYCAFEYGVANNPKSPDTRIILLQCCDAVPNMFAGQVNINVRELVDVQKFVNQLLTDPDFFHEHGGPITRHQPNSDTVNRAAQNLFQALQPLLPPLVPPPLEEWPAYPFLQLELSIEHVETIKKASPSERLRIASELIQEKSKVSASDKELERLFNLPGLDKGVALAHYINLWKEKDDRADAQSKWVESLCRQIMEGARWQFPPNVWELMQGVNGGPWYAPILTRVKRVPGQSMQFDIYFFKFELDKDGKVVKVGIPQNPESSSAEGLGT